MWLSTVQSELILQFFHGVYMKLILLFFQQLKYGFQLFPFCPEKEYPEYIRFWSFYMLYTLLKAV